MRAPSPAQLGAVIRRLRTKQHLSIETLAATADIHATYLSGIERGHGNPTWRVIASLADALDIEISELAHHAEELARQERERRESSSPRAPS